MSNLGWIKLYRSLLDWEWHTDPQMTSLFVHSLLLANTKDASFRGYPIKRGQFITSRASLSAITGISEQSIRTCMKRLKASGEIVEKSTNKFTIVTICKYEVYQARIDAINRQLNTNKEYKNTRIKKEDSSFSWARLSAAEQEQEKQNFIEIFFFKNYMKPGDEAESFIEYNTAANWSNNSGKTFTTREQRLALARRWRPDKTKAASEQEKRIKQQGFLPIWRDCYERCKLESPEIAKAFLHRRTDCRPLGDKLSIIAAPPALDWIKQNDEHLNLIQPKLERLAKAQGLNGLILCSLC